MTEARTQLARGRAQCARRGQALVAALVALTSTPGAAQHQHASTAPDTGVHRRAVVGGVVVDLALTPTAARADGSLVEGEDVTVRLALTDSTGAPLAGLPVAAWVDRRAAGGATTDSVCRLQIQSYLRGSLQFRPTVDLNSHFVVSLNTGNSISVLDPLVSFSVSQVYAGVVLAGEGEDWALAADGRRLFVTLPQVNLVAVVNTETWKVDTNLAVGQRPTRIVAAPDGRSVWVSDEGPRGQAPGVTIIDAGGAAVVRHVATGRGPHDLAFRDDGAAVYVANAGAGSLTAIDAATLAVAATVPTGPRPVAAAFARAGSAVYVGDGVDGSITVVDAVTHAVRARLDAEPGLATLRFDASGRWGFALNATRNEITILDAAAARVSHTVPFGDGPDQVVFTEGFAHVRSSHSTAVAMISLTALAVGDSVHLMPYVAGQYAPDALGGPWPATGMAPASHHDMPDAIYIASPADKSVYQFHYMMGTPMAGGRFNAFPFEPRAVLVVSRSMREREPGVQEATFRAPPAGAYDVVLLVREPRVVRCLGFEVAAAPTRAVAAPTALRVEAVTPGQHPAPGEASTVALRLVDGTTGEPRAGVTDLVAYVTSPTGWSERRPARSVGDGVYEFGVTFPAPGVYYVAVASRSLRTRFDNQVPFALVAADREGAGPR